MTDQPALFAAAEAADDPRASGQLPQWLLARLQDRARHDPRRTRWARCPTCQAVILAGDDFDTLAIPVTADPTPLDLYAEARAILTGRHIFQAVPARTEAQDQVFKLHRVAPHPDHRGAGTYLIPNHVCGDQLADPTLIEPDPPIRAADDPAPF